MAVSRNDSADTTSTEGVRERLLDAAEALFCERGFGDTHVRDIASAARCNIASVNYYFGGKDKLYAEVWNRQLQAMRQTRLDSISKVMSDSGGQPRLEDLLRAFANALIEPVLDVSRGRRLMRLMAREMIDRRLPEDVFRRELIMPTLTALQEALLRACPTLDESRGPLVILSIIGQLMHALHFKTMFEQTGSAELPHYDLTELVDHVVEFSAAGIRACARRGSNEEVD